jgi:hypothetical protein
LKRIGTIEFKTRRPEDQKTRRPFSLLYALRPFAPSPLRSLSLRSTLSSLPSPLLCLTFDPNALTIFNNAEWVGIQIINIV